MSMKILDKNNNRYTDDRILNQSKTRCPLSYYCSFSAIDAQPTSNGSSVPDTPAVSKSHQVDVVESVDSAIPVWRRQCVLQIIQF